MPLAPEAAYFMLAGKGRNFHLPRAGSARIASRLLLAPAALSTALAARVAELSRDRTVLVIAARRPADTLLRGYEQAGADLDHVFVLDATGSAGLQAHANVTTIGSPSLLELIAKRADQLLRRIHGKRRMTVITDDLACFAQYNPGAAMQEILHYSFSQLRPAPRTSNTQRRSHSRNNRFSRPFGPSLTRS